MTKLEVGGLKLHQDSEFGCPTCIGHNKVHPCGIGDVDREDQPNGHSHGRLSGDLGDQVPS